MTQLEFSNVLPLLQWSGTGYSLHRHIVKRFLSVHSTNARDKNFWISFPHLLKNPEAKKDRLCDRVGARQFAHGVKLERARKPAASQLIRVLGNSNRWPFRMWGAVPLRPPKDYSSIYAVTALPRMTYRELVVDARSIQEKPSYLRICVSKIPISCCYEPLPRSSQPVERTAQ